MTEKVHALMRSDWGFPDAPDAPMELRFKSRFRGIRPAPGYPSQPDHTEKALLFRLLAAERIGVALTEHYAMTPAASVSGLVFSHPQAVYFDVGRVGREQLEDYAARKGMAVSEAERWLSSNLAYDPS